MIFYRKTLFVSILIFIFILTSCDNNYVDSTILNDDQSFVSTYPVEIDSESKSNNVCDDYVSIITTAPITTEKQTNTTVLSNTSNTESSDLFEDSIELPEYNKEYYYDISQLKDGFCNIDICDIKTLRLNIDEHPDETIVNDMINVENLYLSVWVDCDISFIANMHNLKSIYVYGGRGTYTYINDLGIISELDTLEEIYIESIKNHIDLNAFLCLPQLNKLTIQDVSNVSCISDNGFGSIQDLSFIEISALQISVDFSTTAPVTKLSLCNSVLNDSQWIKNLSNLEILEYKGVYSDSMAMLEVCDLSQLSKLNSLDLRGQTNVDANNIINTERLERLYCFYDTFDTNVEFLIEMLPDCNIAFVTES